MARTVAQITKELGSVYNPQIQAIQNQKATIGQGVQADIQQANAAKDTAFGEIMGGARRRGMGFSGIPLAEQAQYSAGTYAPEVLRAQQRGRQQELSLQDALNQIYERRNQYANTLRQQDLATDQWNKTFAFEKQKWADQLREQAAQRAAAARAASAGFGSFGGGGGAGSPSGGYGMKRKGDGGFAFVDAQGNPISAAAYAAGTGTPFRQLLQTMANQGDSGAKQALGFVGDDFGYDPRKVNSNLYNALTWGTGRSATPVRMNPVAMNGGLFQTSGGLRRVQ